MCPNWCECELTIEGNYDDLQKFVTIVKTKDNEIDTNKIIPYPEKFRKLDEVAHDWRTKQTKYFEENLKSPNNNDQRKMLWANFIKEHGDQPKDGFNSGGYEWCHKNWGTKWGLCNTRIQNQELDEKYKDDNYIHYKFETAWSPPIPIVQKMGEMFPMINFTLEYWECGAQFQGTLIVEKGITKVDEEHKYYGHRGG